MAGLLKSAHLIDEAGQQYYLHVQNGKISNNIRKK